ncbi:MAG: toprim domain-containing protein [Bacteroidetes bacterium]|nr:toprim domain-containing protein [Bacteroidota bacterium]
MNIEQAKSIPISVILDKLNLAPQRTSGHRVLYFSPFRREKTPSLWVDTKNNLWRDFGDSKWIGGDIIHLVRGYLNNENENCEVTDALRWLRNMTGFIPDIKPVIDPDEVSAEKTLVLREVNKIKQVKLIEYGNNRGIPESILRTYFVEAAVFNTKTQKKFYSLCMRNDLKGYELRNPYFKGCIGKKYITFIRGTKPKPEGINIFEGAFDFASAIAQLNGKPFENDSLILHSLSNLKKASAYLKNYGYRYAYTWMDNDEPGIEATKSWEGFCKTEENLLHVPMNEIYLPYKDVNAAHMAKLEL